jgi:hypothetical protein
VRPSASTKRKSKWLSAKQVDRLGKSFWYHGIDFLKTGEPPVIRATNKNQSIFELIIISIMVSSM